ncbi:RecQ family ATP-dependent DNA helicase [bacterium]|nr:RecQ family ATP-dependent DNA helicase [bacterium]
MGLVQYSYSKIATFLECPKRYHFQYILNIPTLAKPYFSFGTSIHNTLRAFHSHEICISLDALQQLYRECWIKEAGYASPVEEQQYFELGLDLLRTYHAGQREEYRRPLLQEERFQLECDQYILTGVIDRIDRSPDGSLEVIDYKTSRRKTSLTELHDNLQLALYGLAVKSMLGTYPQRMSLYYLRFNEKMGFSPEPGYFERTQERLDGAVKSICESEQRAQFPAHPGNLCIYCDYYKRCSEGNRSGSGPGRISDGVSTGIGLGTVEVASADRAEYLSSQDEFQEILERAGDKLIEKQLTLLRTNFPFDHFRPGQLEVILSVLLNGAVLAVMPTGGGKSLCYQLLSLAMEGLTVVISPLIALMKDQVEGIRELGFRNATFLNTSLSLDQYKKRISAIIQGETKLVYLAPEALRNRNIVRILDQRGVSLLVIDEAHCISQWGHDFRPDYLNIKSLRSRWAKARVLAMTATATPEVQRDIRNQLGSSDMMTLVTSIDRPNLFFEVVQVLSDQDKQARLAELLAELEGEGIIYVNTRKHAEKIAEMLQDWGYEAAHYHAGMKRTERSRVQDAFMSGRLPLVVATNAFGMGIDKPDIRFIIHYHLPGSLEAYYQEIGRAGRDGAQSRTILFYSESDRGIQQFFIENAIINELNLRQLLKVMGAYKCGDYLLIPHGTLEKQTNLEETPVRVALCQMEKEGILVRLPDVSLEMLISLNPFGSSTHLDDHDLDFFENLIRTIGVRPDQSVTVTLKTLAQQFALPPDAVEEALLNLKFFNMINIKTVTRGFALKLLDDRSGRSVSAIAEGLLDIAREKTKKLEALNTYCLTPVCRRYVVRTYFGETHVHDKCGHCDNCRGGHLLKVELLESQQPGSINVSACLRLVETLRFPMGRNRLAEILAGSNNKEIKSRKLNFLPGYGSLKEHGIQNVKALLTTALRLGYLDIFYRPDDEMHKFPLIRISPEGKNIAQSEQDYYIPLQSTTSMRPRPRQKKREQVRSEKEVTTPRKRTRKAGADRTLLEQKAGALDQYQLQLYEELKKWRLDMARKLRTKAFYIFSNETLELIAFHSPRTFDELLAIKGVGSVKLTDYGQEILNLIKKQST